ncbi:hypothetical protein VTN77DRAFT_3498 [Rasamsonia byssochlamydoides]|uniref:uncharacterized protein n=1 Tax=Rasamsonia byssochlamydoides TaxID=89139 RepID=UPI00374252A4
MPPRKAAVAAKAKISRKWSAEETANPPSKKAKYTAKSAKKEKQKTARETASRSAAAKPVVINTAPTARLDIFVFGDGSAGELGLGPKNAINVKTPRLNVNLHAETVGVVDIAAGGMHTVALTHDDKVLTWGISDNCALGRDTTWEGGMKDIDNDSTASEDSDLELNPRESTPAAVPVDKFPAGTKFVRVAAGDSSTFALTEDGSVYGWGTFLNNEGKDGFSLKPDTNEVINTQSDPLLIPNLKRIVDISAGNNFCLALSSDASVYSWGRNEQNQLGRRILVDRRCTARTQKEDPDIEQLRSNAALLPGLVPLPLGKRKKIVSIHAGGYHAFAIDSDGDTWAWGLNNFGQTGIPVGAGNSSSTIVTPQKVPSLAGKKMKMLQGGNHHSIGVTQTGECLVWGRMDGAQMGIDINQLPLDDPRKVISERGWPRILLEPTALAIADCVYATAGSDHNILVTRDGKAYSWGFNESYQCGQGSEDEEIRVATLIDASAVREKKLCWAGAGGQYSMLAAPHEG